MADTEYVPKWLHEEVVRRLDAELTRCRERLDGLDEAEKQRNEQRTETMAQLARVIERSNTLNVVLLAAATILGVFAKGR